MPSQYTPPLQDSLFLLTKVVDWQQLFALPRYAHVDEETATAVLTAGARFAEHVLGPMNAASDVQGSQLVAGHVITPDEYKQAWREFTENGWSGLDLPDSVGGQGLPLTLQVAIAEMINGACLAFAMLPIMLRAASWLLLEHADKELAERVVPKLVTGEWAATICISESQAGSDVGRMMTTAVAEEAGSYRLSGTKIFISYGDHDLTEQIVHMVLARTPDAPAGTRGISLFLVPKNHFSDNTANGVSVSRVEKKMGLKGSPTCVLELDNATGYRIGELHRGLNNMFTMVNLMRLEVSIQGPAVAWAATQKALKYANERPQGGKPDAQAVMLIEHADIRRMLLVMLSKTQSIRALVFEAAMNLDLSLAAEDEQAGTEARKLAEFLLPVCKACGSETGFDVSNLAMQIYGGHGYVADAGIEQYVRDVRVASIYEGSNGIQALDLLLRKLLKDNGERYQLFIKRIQADLLLHADNARLATIHHAVDTGLSVLERISQYLMDENITSLRSAEAGATDYLQLVGKLACAWMWLRMAAAETAGENQLACANFYAQHIMPEMNVHAERIVAGSDNIDAYDFRY